MLIKTEELIGPALNWAVAKCKNDEGYFWACQGEQPDVDDTYCPSSDWSKGGPIIERERITIAYLMIDGAIRWEARYFDDQGHFRACEFGPTPLIAAMRCLVASKLGDEIELPEEFQ
jgi:hypothetical protein